ncbi:5-deoxy-glucuronate isomerase [Brevibacillus marinus]|uniref:5-deoxy-glucuronate isomerase n=1 Tax=Brevibacillus marinus TaxID=2496837 RepID=UPI000F83A164|nr:5-deoxy-glucuronate isomerase [Brevibacillus marinus]
MSQLIIPSQQADERGNVLTITPERAGWQYVGFAVFTLQPGQALEQETGEREVCLVLLSGIADLATRRAAWKNVGRRMDLFAKLAPYAAYVPAGDRYTVAAVTRLEVAVCSAPGKGTYPARLITPADVGVELRGAGNVERLIHNILPEQQPADSLLVVEVFTPEGHWSSYPPHKHDVDDLPHESRLEETYYHRIRPAHGFAVQRVYTDDRSLDAALVVRDGDAVLVPRGYHPVAAAPGYDLYYLNVMAGPVRTWKFRNDPEHAWVLESKLAAQPWRKEG